MQPSTEFYKRMLELMASAKRELPTNEYERLLTDVLDALVVVAGQGGTASVVRVRLPDGGTAESNDACQPA